jgi:hypothetical protein
LSHLELTNLNNSADSDQFDDESNNSSTTQPLSLVVDVGDTTDLPLPHQVPLPPSPIITGPGSLAGETSESRISQSTLDQVLNSYANGQPLNCHPILSRIRPDVNYAMSLRWLSDVPDSEANIVNSFFEACHGLAGIEANGIDDYNAVQGEHFAIIYHMTRITPFLLRTVLSGNNRRLRFLITSMFDLLMSIHALMTADDEVREELQNYN